METNPITADREIQLLAKSLDDYIAWQDDRAQQKEAVKHARRQKRQTVKSSEQEQSA